jgi:hypothetical protein
MFEIPFYSHNIGDKGVGHQVPSVVEQQGLVLFFHNIAPLGIGKHVVDRGRDGRCWLLSDDGEVQMVHILGDPGSTMGDNRMCAVYRGPQ